MHNIKQKVELSNMSAYNQIKDAIGTVRQVFYIAECYQGAKQTATYHHTIFFNKGVGRVRKNRGDREAWVIIAKYVGVTVAVTFATIAVSGKAAKCAPVPATLLLAWQVARLKGSEQTCEELRNRLAS